jgi:hypothetical protein
MTLALIGLMLFTLAGYLVWRAANRLWHVLVIMLLAALLFPIVASGLIGDPSYYLPAGTFSKGIEGKDQIVVASAVATILISIILAACTWTAAKAAWRYCQGWKN